MSPVISNTSPLTKLAVIGHLGLVRSQWTRVVVPQAVWQEMLVLPHPQAHSALLSAQTEG
jgi:predicted nucleic acid-binding protein